MKWQLCLKDLQTCKQQCKKFLSIGASHVWGKMATMWIWSIEERSKLLYILHKLKDWVGKNHQFLYHADNRLTDHVMSFLWGAVAPSAPVLSLCPCLWVNQQSRCKRADSVGCVVRLLIHKLGWIYPFCLMRLKCCDAEVVKEHTRWK